MCTKQHLNNMAIYIFLAGITKFKGMNWELVKGVIQRECKNVSVGTLILSKYCLELAFEMENVSLYIPWPLSLYTQAFIVQLLA